MVMCTSRHGHATVVLECHDPCEDTRYGKAEVVTLKHSYPLKVMVPEYAGNQFCRWIYPIVFGGGLVGGDQMEINVETKANTCGLLTSQESSKVYHCDDGLLTSQNMNYTIGDNSLLCVLPDYCVCYKDANFSQTQKVKMSESGNIVLLDWMTCGRTALDEEWLFTSFKNKIEIEVGGQNVYTDSVHLHNVPGLTMKKSMKNYKAMGTCVILGKWLKEMSNSLYKQYSKPRKYGETVNKDLICTVSTLQTGGVSGIYLRFLAVDTSQAYTVIREIVEPLLPLLGADPFHNKY